MTKVIPCIQQLFTYLFYKNTPFILEGEQNQWQRSSQTQTVLTTLLQAASKFIQAFQISCFAFIVCSGAEREKKVIMVNMSSALQIKFLNVQLKTLLLILLYFSFLLFRVLEVSSVLSKWSDCCALAVLWENWIATWNMAPPCSSCYSAFTCW